MAEAEFSFVTIMHALFEPELKLRITADIPYQADSNFEIRIEHDPAISSGNLTMPPPAWLVDGWSAANPAPPPKSVPFRSERSRGVATLWGRIENRADRVDFVITALSDGFTNVATKLEAALDGRVAGQAFELLLQIIGAAVDLPFWDEIAKREIRDTRGDRPTKAASLMLGLCVERVIAEQLVASSSFTLDDEIDGDVLIAQRGVRP